MNDLWKISGLRELTPTERAAFDKFEREMREVVVPKIVQKVRARQRRAAEQRGKHTPLY